MSILESRTGKESKKTSASGLSGSSMTERLRNTTNTGINSEQTSSLSKQVCWEPHRYRYREGSRFSPVFSLWKVVGTTWERPWLRAVAGLMQNSLHYPVCGITQQNSGTCSLLTELESWPSWRGRPGSEEAGSFTWSQIAWIHGGEWKMFPISAKLQKGRLGRGNILRKGAS
jgi:hypothetical protein